MEVPLENRISELLEKQLIQTVHSDRSYYRYEIMNFGVVGYGTAQELETFRHRVLQFDPDMAILFVYLGNDLFNNSRELDPEPNRLHYALNDSGDLVRLPFTISDNFIKRWLRHHSKAYLFVRDRIKTVQAISRTLRTLGLMQKTIPPGDESKRPGPDLLQKSQYLLDTPPPIERAWLITETLIGELQRLSFENSVPLRLVIIPTKEQILNTPPKTLEINQFDMQKSIQTMDEICHRLEIDCLQLADAFRGPQVSVEECFFENVGHWTEIGHAVAAQAVSEWLRRPLGLVSAEANDD